MKPCSFYEQIADDYNEPLHEKFYAQIARNLISNISNIRPINKILEVGAGTGFSTSLIRKQFPEAEIIAIEPSRSMLLAAQTKTRNINWIAQAFADYLPDHKYDLVFSSMAAHWLSLYEWQKLIALCDNSILALSLPSIDNRELVSEQANKALRKVVFKLRGSNNWSRQSRNLSPLLSRMDKFSSRIDDRDLLIKERYTDADKLVNSLYHRGVFMALFGDKSEAAKKMFLGVLNEISRSESFAFNWAFKLVITYPKPIAISRQLSANYSNFTS